MPSYRSGRNLHGHSIPSQYEPYTVGIHVLLGTVARKKRPKNRSSKCLFSSPHSPRSDTAALLHKSFIITQLYTPKLFAMVSAGARAIALLSKAKSPTEELRTSTLEPFARRLKAGHN